MNRYRIVANPGGGDAAREAFVTADHFSVSTSGIAYFYRYKSGKPGDRQNDVLIASNTDKSHIQLVEDTETRTVTDPAVLDDIADILDLPHGYDNHACKLLVTVTKIPV